MTPHQELLIFQADALLAAPPPLARIVRPEPCGAVLARAVLPLDLCQPQNRTRHGQSWALAKIKSQVAHALLAQIGRLREPLPGRPQVLCVRFSSVEPDAYSDWAKHAVDSLCVPKGRARNRLGWLCDDSPGAIDLHQWWEPAPAGQGFVYIRILEGKP